MMYGGRWQFVYFNQVSTVTESETPIGHGECDQHGHGHPVDGDMSIGQLGSSHHYRLDQITNEEGLTHVSSKVSVVHGPNVP